MRTTILIGLALLMLLAPSGAVVAESGPASGDETCINGDSNQEPWTVCEEDGIVCISYGPMPPQTYCVNTNVAPVPPLLEEGCEDLPGTGGIHPWVDAWELCRNGDEICLYNGHKPPILACIPPRH